MDIYMKRTLSFEISETKIFHSNESLIIASNLYQFAYYFILLYQTSFIYIYTYIYVFFLI